MVNDIKPTRTFVFKELRDSAFPSWYKFKIAGTDGWKQAKITWKYELIKCISSPDEG